MFKVQCVILTTYFLPSLVHFLLCCAWRSEKDKRLLTDPYSKKILDYKETGGCTLISGPVIFSVQTTNGNPEYELFSLWSSKQEIVPAAPKSPWQKKNNKSLPGLIVGPDWFLALVDCALIGQTWSGWFWFLQISERYSRLSFATDLDISLV